MTGKPPREVLDQLFGPRPFVLCADRPARQASPTTERCAVLSGRAADPEFDEMERLLRYLHVPVIRLAAGPANSCPVDISPDGWLAILGQAVRPTVYWSRAEPWSVATDARDVLRQESARTLAAQIGVLSPTPLPGARLGLVEQLADANRAGVRVPRTLVTSDPGSAAAGLVGPGFVLKVLGPHFVKTAPGQFHAAFARVLTRADVVSLTGSDLPVVLQEYVDHTVEYRVYYVGGRIFAFEVAKPSPDAPWTRPEAVTVRRCPVAGDVSHLVRFLASRWNLRFGAFDLLRTPDGLVFLEANEDGDWRWFEIKAGSRCISMAAALLIRELHTAAGGAAAGPASDGFDLMSFLTA